MRQSLHGRDGPSPNSSYREWTTQYPSVHLLLAQPVQGSLFPTGRAWGCPSRPNASYAPHIQTVSPRSHSASPSALAPRDSLDAQWLRRLMAVTPEPQLQHLLTSCTTLSRLLPFSYLSFPGCAMGTRSDSTVGKSKHLAGYPTRSQCAGGGF